MKTLIKTAIIGICLVLVSAVELPSASPLIVQMVPEAHAIFGVRRRALRRGVIIGGSMAAAGAMGAFAAEAQSQPATIVAPAPAAAPAPAPAPAPTGKPLPIGTVVPTLPDGCTSTPVGDVEYYYCGGNFYRAVFQGNKLVYVTAKP